jgi:hypothetical protein
VAAFFEGFVDELIQFNFCKQMQTQRIDQIGKVPFVLGIEPLVFEIYNQFWENFTE